MRHGAPLISCAAVRSLGLSELSQYLSDAWGACACAKGLEGMRASQTVKTADARAGVPFMQLIRSTSSLAPPSATLAYASLHSPIFFLHQIVYKLPILMIAASPDKNALQS